MSQIRAIQILRALAALMVVFSHAQGDAQFQALKFGGEFARNLSLPWVAGVDLFFVTSGFIMVHASRGMFGEAAAPRTFLTRRLIRIVPLYWSITAISLVIAFFVARAGKEPFPPLAEILGSFGFVPYANAAHGDLRPIAGQGWTLNYEMFFYVLFALFLRFERDVAILGVAAALAVVVALGAWLRPDNATLAFWSDPIVLEFALGMGLAWAWGHGLRMSRIASAALALAAVALLALDLDSIRAVPLGMAEPNGFLRLLGCGAPMAMLFAAAVLIRPELSGKSGVADFAAAVGDASYALYLFHPLAIIFTRKAYLAAHGDARMGLWPLVGIEVVVAVAFAFGVYRFVESPVTRRLQRAFGGRGKVARAEMARPLASKVEREAA